MLYRKFADAVEIDNPPKGVVLCWVIPVEDSLFRQVRHSCITCGEEHPDRFFDGPDRYGHTTGVSYEAV